MKTRIYLIGIILIIMFALALASNGSDLTQTIFQEPTPAEIHQWLWENELKPELLKRQEIEKYANKTITNWQEYDVNYYDLNLTIDEITEVIYGNVGVFGTVSVSGLDSIKINLLDSMTVDSIYDGDGNLIFSHSEDHLTVYLDKPHALGEEFSFHVVYHGTPGGSVSFQGFSFGERLSMPLIATLSEPYGARSWWPCNDIPRDKADSVDIRVTVDTSLVVSSNGTLLSDIDNLDGSHTVHWHEGYPIATYLVSLGIHPYTVWYDWYNYSPTDSMPLDFFVFPDQESLSRTSFAVLPNMINVLSGRFGEYPFIDEKYGCTHFGWTGAMEHQTNTSTAASSFGYSQPVVVHELGHQWWGDMVTCDDWHHIWLNEGFATYAEALYFEEENGTAYYHDYMESFEYTGGGSIYIDDTTSISDIFGIIVYDKGGWVLHMLRHVVGDSLFFESLQNYREQYLWKSATTEDFRDVVEATSGMDLDWFFEQWIYGTDRPVYYYSFTVTVDPNGGYNIYLHLRQAQGGTVDVFTMPIDVKLTTFSNSYTEVIFNNEQDQNFILHSDYMLADLKIDPERWISRLAFEEDYTLHIVNEELAEAWQYYYFEDSIITRGGADVIYELVDGTLPDGYNLDSETGVISGTTADTGSFAFSVKASEALSPAIEEITQFTLHVNKSPVSPGDANFDEHVNIADASYIINYVFFDGAAPPVLNLADANGDCQLNIADASYLINSIFFWGNAPIMGCVE